MRAATARLPYLGRAAGEQIEQEGQCTLIADRAEGGDGSLSDQPVVVGGGGSQQGRERMRIGNLAERRDCGLGDGGVRIRSGG